MSWLEFETCSADRKHFIYLFFMWENSTFWKVYFVYTGELVKPRLFRALIKGACHDLNLKPAGADRKFFIITTHLLGTYFYFYQYHPDSIKTLQQSLCEENLNIWMKSNFIINFNLSNSLKSSFYDLYLLVKGISDM